MRPGINPRKRPRPNRWLRRQTGVNLEKLIMALFPATSWKGNIPMFEDGKLKNTGVIWGNIAEPPPARMNIDYLTTGIFKDHPIVNRNYGRALTWGHVANVPPIPDLVRRFPLILLNDQLNKEPEPKYRFYIGDKEITGIVDCNFPKPNIDSLLPKPHPIPARSWTGQLKLTGYDRRNPTGHTR